MCSLSSPKTYDTNIVKRNFPTCRLFLVIPYRPQKQDIVQQLFSGLARCNRCSQYLPTVCCVYPAEGYGVKWPGLKK